MKQYFLFVFLSLLMITLSCHKDRIDSAAASKLDFSTDTIMFDTVFTTVGSSTQWLQVYNPHSKKIIISSIRIGKGASSFFRINVNGKPGREFTNVEIAGKDSLFIFVEVTVDPNKGTNPMVVTDSIIFETNGNKQDVDLVAWGQDAYFHTPDKESIFSTTACPGSDWNNDKPHVIYGYVVVPPFCVLNINAGAQVHIHHNSGLIVYKQGTLKINGTAAAPVVIQGDRLEAAFKDLPGQWDRIWLYAGCVDNVINYAVIKNGNVGLQIDTVGNANPTLVMSNTIIQNMGGAGIYTQGSKVKAYNCVFGDCGIHSALLAIGGDYSFYHCTFANYYSQDTRQTPLLGLNNNYEDVNKNYQERDFKAYFGNCIFYGKQEKEIAYDYITESKFQYLFEYCILKSDSSYRLEASKYPAKYSNMLIDKYPMFVDTVNADYSLRAGSPAIDEGSSSITSTNILLSTDIRGTTRSGIPDIGAYEK